MHRKIDLISALHNFRAWYNADSGRVQIEQGYAIITIGSFINKHYLFQLVVQGRFISRMPWFLAAACKPRPLLRWHCLHWLRLLGVTTTSQT